MFWQDRRGGLPDTGKLIREGIRAAWKVIEEMPAEGTPHAYLAALKGRIEAVAERCRLHPYSRDSWNDEDSWIVGGINAIRNEVEEQETSMAGAGISPIE